MLGHGDVGNVHSVCNVKVDLGSRGRFVQCLCIVGQVGASVHELIHARAHEEVTEYGVRTSKNTVHDASGDSWLLFSGTAQARTNHDFKDATGMPLRGHFLRAPLFWPSLFGLLALFGATVDTVHASVSVCMGYFTHFLRVRGLES